MIGRGRLATIALVASLAANGLLGAYVVTSGSAAEPTPSGQGSSDDLMRLPVGQASLRDILTELADKLPEDDGLLLRAAIDDNGARLDAATASLSPIRERVSAHLAAPNVDADALRDVLEAARAARLEAGEAVVEVLADALPRMSHATRSRIAAALRLR